MRLGHQNSTKKIGSPLRGSDIKIATTKHWLAATRLGHQNSKKNWLTASRLMDDAPHCPWVKPPPPWKKARSAPDYTWFAPSYSETISFGVIVKSAIRAFRKHYTLYTFTRVCTSHGPPNAKKWCFTLFSFVRNHPVNFQATLLILSNYSVNLACLGPVSLKIGGLRANIWSQGTVKGEVQ